MTDLLMPRSVVVHARDAHVIDLDGEKVVYVPASQTLHHLDQMASLVWDCLSPESSLDEVARDLADAFAVDSAAVLNDVIAAVNVLVEARALVCEGGDVAST